MKYIFILFLLWSCKEKQPTKPIPNYYEGGWVSKDSTKNKFYFKSDGLGSVYFGGNWYDMQWQEKGSQGINLTWFGRTQYWWVFDKGQDSFNLCLIDRNCTTYYRK